jgi:hypothetical protein
VKRGLVELNPSVPPQAERSARVDTLRSAARSAGADVALVYGDVARSDDIAYLTNLCIYWNEGVLAVPSEGDPVFLTKLSKRVHPWMRATSTVDDLRSGQSLAALVAELAPARIGMVDRDLWPAQLVEDVEAACPGSEIVDLPDAVRRERALPSESELTLLRDAGRSLAAALERGTVASVERSLRRAGATDAFVSRETAPDGTATVDATVQHGSLWLRAARPEGGPLARALQRELVEAAAQLRAGVRPSEVAGAGCTSHADLATGGELRALVAADADLPVRAGEVVALALDAPGATAAGTYLVGESGAESLTGRGGGNGRLG